MSKPVNAMTHEEKLQILLEFNESSEEKLQLLRDIKENYEADTERLQDLLAWFIAVTGYKKSG